MTCETLAEVRSPVAKRRARAWWGPDAYGDDDDDDDGDAVGAALAEVGAGRGEVAGVAGVAKTGGKKLVQGATVATQAAKKADHMLHQAGATVATQAAKKADQVDHMLHQAMHKSPEKMSPKASSQNGPNGVTSYV